MTIFRAESKGLYRKYQETHFQKAYDLAVVRSFLERAGMNYITAYDAFTREPPRKESERIYVVAMEQGKEA